MVKKYNPDQWWNNNKCQCECKKRHVCEKDCIWNPSTYNCESSFKKFEDIQKVLWMIQQLRVMKLQSHTMKKQKVY